MPDEELVVVHTFSNRAEADVAASALDAAGIDAMIRADDGGGMRPAMAWAGVGFGVIVRASAEMLPWRDASFDRVFCVNALHHFADRQHFFAEARRVLRPGGGLLTIGKDPHAERDDWWVYQYFPETLDIDRARFAAVRTLRGELSRAGFAWAESSEADRIEAVMTVDDAFAGGVLDRSYTSQLTVLTDEEFGAGVDRLLTASTDAAGAGGTLDLVTDFRLYATAGWLR